MNGQDIRAYRHGEGLSQKKLGRLLGYSEQQIARWEKEQARPPGPARTLLYVLMHWQSGASVRDMLADYATENFRAELKNSLDGLSNR